MLMGVVEIVVVVVLACPVPLGIAIVVVIVRRCRDRVLAREWDTLLCRAARGDCRLARVLRVYQYARRGSKAIIGWEGGARQDTWFEGWHAPVGSYVLVTGGSGWGPHNSNPNVFFVVSGGVLAVAPARARAAWERRSKRRSRSGRSPVRV